MHLSDLEYVERCRNGQVDNYRFLVERYEGPVFAFVASRMSDRSTAREIVAESFVRAFFSLGKLKKPEAFHSWVLGIAGRVLLEFQRGRFRRQEVPVDDATMAAPAETAAPDYDPLDEAIATLSPSHRELILLRYFQHLSCQEIAERLSLPIGTVTKNLSRAYAELRALLTGAERRPTAICLENSP